MGRYLSNFARSFDGQSFGEIDEAILNDAEAIYLSESAELAGEA